MVTINKYVYPESLDDAYKVLKDKKTNAIVGGCAWLRLQKKRIDVAIDLSKLSLNYIKEENENIEIGAMTTLREVETSVLLKEYFGDVLKDSVKSIVGVQFRNIVTVGASVFSKFGFSDFLPALIALDAKLHLYNGGIKSIEEFMKEKYEKDILIKVILPKEKIKASYKMLRASASDFPLINVCVAKRGEEVKIVCGAKPSAATVAKETSELLTKEGIKKENIDKVVEMASSELKFGTNSRGSKKYRKAMSKVLIRRAIMEVI